MCALADQSVQGYRLPPRRDALTATAATAVVAARRTLPTESRKRGSRRGGGDTCIPRRPRVAAGPTPAYIHPQLLPLPSSTSFSLPLALLHAFPVCSLIIHRFFLSPFSSKLCAPHRRLILHYMFPVLFVNSISSSQRLSTLCIFLLLPGISRKTIPFHNMQFTLFYFILCSIFLAFTIFHFDPWLFVSLSYYIAFPAPSAAVPSILPRSFVTVYSHRYCSDQYRTNLYIYKD